MISLAVFAWKGFVKHETLNSALLWCGSVMFARKHFSRVVLVADKRGQDFLVKRLELPFTSVLDLPVLPDELQHIYELPKLAAITKMTEPFARLDHDVHIYQPVPKLPLFCDGRGPRHPVLDKHNQALDPRLVLSGNEICGSGIIGGTNVKVLNEMALCSLAVALNSANREYLKTAQGYQVSALLGEAALGSVPGVVSLQDQVSYIHYAGDKSDLGRMAHAILMTQIHFPKEADKTIKNFYK